MFSGGGENSFNLCFIPIPVNYANSDGSVPRNVSNRQIAPISSQLGIPGIQLGIYATTEFDKAKI